TPCVATAKPPTITYATPAALSAATIRSGSNAAVVIGDALAVGEPDRRSARFDREHDSLRGGHRSGRGRQQRCAYDCGVPFTRTNLKADLEDVGSNFDGAPDLEFRMATKALELERSGLTYQRVPPGYRFPYGHTHKTQEEVYVVVRGSGRMKVDEEIVELKEWDAVRVPPGTWRGYEAGPDGLEILVIGAPSLGEAQREDVDGLRDWWTRTGGE